VWQRKAIRPRANQWSSRSGSISNDTRFDELRLLADPIGEIVITGAHALKAYINNDCAGAKQKIDVEGPICYRTGNTGYQDKKSVLYLHEPFKEIVRYNGHNSRRTASA
jgi:hypothetical protein